MELHTPFQGTLLLPQLPYFSRDSPVILPHGRVVALVRWLSWNLQGAFELLDPHGQLIAEGAATGFFKPRYRLHRPDGAVLLEWSLGWSGARGRSTVTLPGGDVLTMRGVRRGVRRFTITDWTGVDVAAVSTTSGWLTFRPPAYQVELARPVLSIVQAAGLAQGLRTAAGASPAR